MQRVLRQTNNNQRTDGVEILGNNENEKGEKKETENTSTSFIIGSYPISNK